MESNVWHILTSVETLRMLKVSREKGLSENEAAEKLKTSGPNELQKGKGTSAWKLFLEQFKDILVIILLIGTALSAFLGHDIEAITIGIIVLLAVVLGFVQEFRAEKAMEALKKMAAPTATVVRDGEQREIPARELVPGDIILLASGDRMPADSRLLEAINLQVEEAALTGESLPVEKVTDALSDGNLPIGDRKNMVFAGTTVSMGRGTAVVTATGMQTEFGKIAGLLQEVKEEVTPLQKNLDRMGKTLAKTALVIVAVISGVGYLQGQGLIDMLIFGVALAVAVVPEALPAVVTISLSIGTQRMARRHALIRRLPAVETLGCTSVICTDKTGTLTKDEMTVRKIWLAEEIFDVSGSGYSPEGSFTRDGKSLELSEGLLELLKAGVLASDAQLITTEHGHDIQGDPTEGALVVAAAKAGLMKDDLAQSHPRVNEIPFSSETKRMTTLHSVLGAGTCGEPARTILSPTAGRRPAPDSLMAYTKGAPEIILPLCTRQWGGSKELPLTDVDQKKILTVAEEMAGHALRVIAIARKGGTDLLGAHHGMKFLGLVGMIDPPRPEAKKAIQECREAGIRVVMITGDHPVTAQAIARELGILDGGKVTTGPELERMEDGVLERDVEKIAVFARVSPSHKLRIVAALQKCGHVVAMTGDGVNDAPALKKADIGIAMGITGTDVTKEAAAMTLTDDNFASIVAAVEEGRGIFGNIKKYLMYLLSSNIGEIAVMTIAALFAFPYPLSAVQLLYLNLVTDGLPAIALAVDPPEADLMRKPPRDPQAGIFTRPVVILMLVGSAWLAILVLGIFWQALSDERPLQEAMSKAFILIILVEFVKAYNFRSDRLSAFSGLFANRWLNLAILGEVVLLIATVHIPFLQRAFGTVPMGLHDWKIITLLALTVIPVLEGTKFFLRRDSSDDNNRRRAEIRSAHEK